MRAIAIPTLAAVLSFAYTAHADTPESRGKAVLAAQLEAVKHWSDASAMAATFAKSASVLLPNGEQAVADGGVASGIALLNPHSTVKEATFDHFTAGGNASVSWFAAELHFTTTSESTTTKSTIRAIELLDGSAGWKVVVAAFTHVSKLAADGSCPVREATPPGPLVKLLIEPDAIASTLDAAAVVFGTDPSERGVGADAKKLLGTWKKLKLSLDTEQKAREVHTATYGYAMTNVTMPASKAGSYPLGMSAFVLALPAANGTWSVIAASYGATF